MNGRYPALKTISLFLKVMAVIMGLFGVYLSLYSASQSGFPSPLFPMVTSPIFSIAILLIFLIYAIFIYAIAELINCITDIEYNTRVGTQTDPVKSISEKQRLIADLQKEVSDELANRE